MYENTSLVATILYWFTTLIIAGLVAGIFMMLSNNNVFLATVLVISLPIILASFYFIRRRKYELVSTTLALMLITLNTILPTDGLGIHSINTIAYPVILMIASLVSRKRTIVLLTSYTLLCLAWLVFREMSGAYVPNNSMHSILGDFFTAAIIIVMTVFVVSRLSGELLNSFLSLQKEAYERKTIEDDLRQRETILETITIIAEQFLKSSDWRSNIDLALEQLGRALHVTHVYLFEDHVGPLGEALTSMRYEWTAPGYPSDLEGPYFKNTKVDQKGFEDQVDALRRGDVRIGTLSTFNPIEKENMESLGVKSILEVPIFVNAHEWGAIGFDDFEQERVWSNEEVGALKIAAGILSAAIQREMVESAVRESERIYRQAIEAAGAVPYYQDYEKSRYTFIGEGIRDITGYEPDKITPEVWDRMVQETVLISDLAGLSEDVAIQRVRSGETKAWKCDYRILTPDGRSRWVADTAIEIFGEHNISFGSIGIMQDITDRKQTEASLRQREEVLEAVTFAAEKFLQSPNWHAGINIVLERLGKALDVTHTYLFEHHLNADGVEVSSLRFEWTAPGFTSDLENPLFQNSHLLRDGLHNTDEILRRGEVFAGNSSTFPQVEKERLAELGIKAMVEVPLFVDNAWWGTIGFDDMVNERDWSASEIDALKIAAGILSAAIRREKAESAVREAEWVYRRAIEAAGAVPYYRNYEENRYSFMGEGIEQIIGYKPEDVTVELMLSIIQENIPLGGGRDLPVDDAVMRSRTGELKVWRSDMRVLARTGEERWVADSAVELFGDSGLSYAAVGILQDVTDRKLIEANLRKRESILEAITFAAEQFLKTPDWRDKIQAVLERLGREFNASHAYLFEKHEDADGNALLSMTYEWTAPGSISDLGDPHFQNMRLQSAGLERMYDILNRGEPLIGNSSLLSGVEQEYLDSIGVRSLLEMRVGVNGEHWGTIGFDDDVNDRKWTSMEVDVIRVAANVLSAAVQRQLDEDALKRELAERRRAEQALKLSEEKFSKAFHTTPVMMTLEDAEGRLVEVNNAFLETLGYEREEVIGHRPFEFNLIPIPEDRDVANRLMRKNNLFKDLELHVRRKSGEIGVVLMSIEYIHVNDTLYVLTSALDITERKRAEQKYRDIFNNSIDGIFQSTEDGHFLSVNPAMARIYGYDSPEEMIHGVNDIVTQLYVYPGQRDEMRRRLASGERLIGFETLDYRRDGTTFWCSMSAQAIFDADGEFLYYEGTVEDISPRKKAEAERETLIQELAKKNAELEQFTYTVSHDLKSPLVTINGFLGYLEQDALSGNVDRLKKDVGRIKDAVYKMQKLLNELLELSRIGRIMNVPETISFGELVNEALDIVHGRLKERGVKIQVQSNFPTVYVDRPRMVEALQNLIDNAAKYMGDQNEPRIEIGQRGEEDGLPVFFVRDNGMGIAPEHHERIFGLFNKLDARSEGTGVGLALVKRIIEVHGGRIWVESEPGKGASFLVTLPSKPGTDSVI